MANCSIWARSMASALNFQSKSVQIPVVAELGLPNPPFDGPLAAAGGRLAEDQFQEVQVRQALLLGTGQRRVEHLGGEGNLERLGVVQDPLAKMLRRVRPGLPGRCRLFLRSVSSWSDSSNSRC